MDRGTDQELLLRRGSLSGAVQAKRFMTIFGNGIQSPYHWVGHDAFPYLARSQANRLMTIFGNGIPSPNEFRTRPHSSERAEHAEQRVIVVVVGDVVAVVVSDVKILTIKITHMACTFIHPLNEGLGP